MMGRKVLSALLSAAIGVGAAAPVAAAPYTFQPSVTVDNGLVTNVDHRNYRKHFKHRKHRFHKRNGHFYLNGHRGYRDRRHGYREYNGYWFPAAAFALGILMLPEVQQGRTIRLTRSHYAWCESRYRSYRRWDNSWQPYNGPRKPCASPYMY